MFDHSHETLTSGPCSVASAVPCGKCDCLGHKYPLPLIILFFSTRFSHGYHREFQTYTETPYRFVIQTPSWQIYAGSPCCPERPLVSVCAGIRTRVTGSCGSSLCASPLSSSLFEGLGTFTAEGVRNRTRSNATTYWTPC
jgi:hypothetical protein